MRLLFPKTTFKLKKSLGIFVKQKTRNVRYGFPFSEKEGLFVMIPYRESNTIIKTLQHT